jgi:hypothetical protein
VLEEGTIDYQRVSCPLILFMTDILGPEAIIVIVKVNRLNKRLWSGFFRIRIRLEIEISHNFLHLRFDLILSDV